MPLISIVVPVLAMKTGIANRLIIISQILYVTFIKSCGKKSIFGMGAVILFVS